MGSRLSLELMSVSIPEWIGDVKNGVIICEKILLFCCAVNFMGLSKKIVLQLYLYGGALRDGHEH